MRAHDIAEPFPTVTLDTGAMEAARAMAAERQPGLLVCGDDGMPYTVLPGSQVLRFLIPAYIQDDPALARTLDEKASDEMCGKLAETTVRDLLPRPQDMSKLPVVDADATAAEMAAVMARMHSPLVAVVSGREILGVITVSRLLGHLLPGPPAQ